MNRWTMAAGLAALASMSPARAAVPPPAPCLAEAASARGPGGAVDIVPAERLAVLARGVNVTNLLGPAAIGDLDAAFAGLRDAGLRHVRLPVSPQTFAVDPPPWQADALRAIDAAVCAALRLGLGVILDMHPTEPVATEALPDLWRQLAARYAAAAPDLIFLELLNEPKWPGAEWAYVQGALAAAIRLAAPGNTLIATASPWSTAAALAALRPLPDRNVVYAYHFYTPMVFTHQGAAWSLPDLSSVAGLQFPASAKNAGPVAAAAAPSLRPVVADYGWRYRSAQPLAAEIALASAWARRWAVPLVVTEFGVFGTAPPTSRGAWLGAVRRAFEADATGWTVWEYAGGFGIADELGPEACLDPAAARPALGLCR